jgi:cysteine desulfurase/selenocysteine lyase
MQTPTSNPVGRALSQDAARAAPAGLPDPSALARLATEFFAALPGAAVSSGLPSGEQVRAQPAAALPAATPALSSMMNNPAPAGSPLAGPGGTGTGVPGAALEQGRLPGGNLLPAAPTHVLSLGNRAPAWAPHAAAQNGLPDSAVSVAPAFEPRFGGIALGVPDAALTAAPAASQPYYFLHDSAAMRFAEAVAGQDLAVPHGESIAAQSFGLLGEGELCSLLSQRFAREPAAISTKLILPAREPDRAQPLHHLRRSAPMRRSMSTRSGATSRSCRNASMGGSSSGSTTLRRRTNHRR